MDEANAVLSFWFDELEPNGLAKKDVSARWYRKNPVFDEEIRTRFGELHERAAKGELDGWTKTPDGRLALVIVLDQFSRNLFRDDPKTYALDEKAQRIALEGIEQGLHRTLPSAKAQFLLMPLMHAENLELQNRCVDLFREVGEIATDEDAKSAANGARQFAVGHRDIIARFGRFPHRNTIIGRASTPEEVEFLKQPGSSF
jgi:uncharacterized protein (DUF924 family)